MNKKYENIDDALYKYFSNKEVPDNISKCIDNAICSNRKKHGKTNALKKAIITIASISVLTGGIVFAKPYIEKLFSRSHGVQQAVENEYVQNIDMDYIEKDDLSFKVSYLIMDDVNFNLVFDFKVTENMNNYQGIALGNLKITDDKENQILYSTEGDEHYKNKALIHGPWEIIEKENNYIRQILRASSFDFPESNTLNISFSDVVVYKVENGNVETKTYTGDFYIQIDVQNQLKNRNTIHYRCNNKYVQDIKASNSGFVVKLKSDKYIENIHLYDGTGNEYKLMYNIQNKDAEIKKYIEDEWIVFFDACIYDKDKQFVLDIDGNKYTLEQEGSTVQRISTKEKPIVPEGFKMVETPSSSWEENEDGTIKGWNNGLVIEDEIGNQFVWVPVSDENITYDGIEFKDDEELELYKYGGFYVARFEAGVPEEVETVKNDINEGTNNIVGKPVSKKGARPWNYISYSNANESAKQMYTQGNIKSGLLSKKKAELIVEWIKNSNFNVNDSTEWGNYSNSVFRFDGVYSVDFGKSYIYGENISKNDNMILSTGITDRNMANNIYDFAGNLREYTNTQFENTKYHYSVGGYYARPGIQYSGGSVSEQYAYADNPESITGFRVCLKLQK